MSAVKRIAESTLSLSLIGSTIRRLTGSDTVVLAYHNIVPPGETPVGDRSLHLPARLFGEHLDAISRTHDIVPLGALRNTTQTRRPRAIVTFDDAYCGAVTAGIEMLAARGLPATVFVAPAFVGGHSFWWDAVSDPATGQVAPLVRDSALREMNGRDASVRREAGRWSIEPMDMPWHAVAASEDDLRRIGDIPGISLGSHSWGHPNLASLDGDELERELKAPMDWLEARFSSSVKWIAYPYGEYSQRVEEAAGRCGYEGGFRIDGGCIRRSGSYGFSYPRINVPAGLSAKGLRLRIDGVLNR